MNVLQILKNDHDRVKSLFDKWDHAGEARSKRKELFEELRKDLLLHSQVEEEIFYPAIKVINERGRQLIVRALNDHKSIDELLTQIERLEVHDARFIEQVETLFAEVDRHVNEEEGQIFQFAEENYPESELVNLGFQVEERKRVIARTLAA